MSTPAHTALGVQQCLIKNSMTPVPHAFYLFCVFASPMKKVIKGEHFASVKEVKQKMAEALKGIKINEFKNCFEQWKIMSG